MKRKFRSVLYSLGTEQLLYGSKNGSGIILNYHGIDLHNRTDFNIRFCSQSDFRNQIRYFKKRFHIVPLPEMFEKSTSRKPRLAITFDDGYRNNYKYALPVLEEEKVHATFFVTALLKSGRTILWADAVDIYSYFLNEFSWEGLKFFKDPVRKRLFCAEKNIFLNPYVMNLSYVEKLKVIDSLAAVSGVKLDSEESLKDYWQLMDEKEIKSASGSPFIDIGSHSELHNNLGEIPIEDARKELLNSKLWLEKVTGKEISSIAYPNGSYTREVLDEAQSLGYKYQLAVKYQFKEDKDDPRILDRTDIYSDRSWIEQLHVVNKSLVNRKD